MKKAGKLIGKQEKTKEMGSGTENVSIKISEHWETFRGDGRVVNTKTVLPQFMKLYLIEISMISSDF